MSKYSRDKGSEIERQIAKELTEAGVPSRRVAGSGAYAKHDSRLSGDIQVGTYGKDSAHWMLTAESKARKGGEGFKVLERWLGDNDILLVRRNYAKPLAVMPWHVLLPLLQAFYEGELDGNHKHGGGDMPGDERLHGGKK
jgi:hypothetical protein